MRVWRAGGGGAGDQLFADKAFVCNRGTEANEGAIKFAHAWRRVLTHMTLRCDWRCQ